MPLCAAQPSEMLQQLHSTQTYSLQVSHVRNLALASFVLGIAVTVYFCALVGTTCLTIAIPSFLLGVCYTAGPFPLKYYALGDVAIFIAFGPMVLPLHP